MPIDLTNTTINPFPYSGGFGDLGIADQAFPYSFANGMELLSGHVRRRGSPYQVLGLVPLNPCTDDDCRTFPESRYVTPVFATASGTDSYKNDYSSFLLYFPFWPAPGVMSPPTFTLEELVGGTYITVATLNNNTYGTFYDFGDLAVPQLTGFRINWRLVLNGIGEGEYRFKVEGTIYGTSTCLVSEPFCVQEFDCTLSNMTTKWEATFRGGKIGSIDDSKVIFNLCGVPTAAGSVPTVTWSDSIRIPGFFGYEKTEYERMQLEYQTGQIAKVRDEAIRKYTWRTSNLPKWVHDRFKGYALLADTLLVSDYNHNNSDYEIKAKSVICSGGYDPDYKTYRRKSFVVVEFKDAIQKIERSRCC